MPDVKLRSFVATSLSLPPSLLSGADIFTTPMSGGRLGAVSSPPSTRQSTLSSPWRFAAQRGLPDRATAFLAIPRLPPIATSGDVRPLLHFEPSELREDLMTVMGFHLGVSPPLEDSSYVPTRLVAVDVFQNRSHLMDEDVYILLVVSFVLLCSCSFLQAK